MQTRVKERVLVDPLAGIEVVSDPFAALAPATDPFARLAPPDPFAGLPDPFAQLRDPFASLGDPFASARAEAAATASPFRSPLTQKHRPPRGKRIVKKTFVMLPGAPKPTMLWVPAFVYGNCFEDFWYNGEEVFRLGDVVDFSEAAESSWGLWATVESECYLHGAPIVSEAETFTADDLPTERYSPLWYDLARSVAEMRAELVADPTPIAELWAGSVGGGYAFMHNMLVAWLGRPVPLDIDVMLAAVTDDPSGGLGGAVLDFCCWIEPEAFGRSGQEIHDYQEEIMQEEYVWLAPVDNFILDPADLHPDTLVADDQDALFGGERAEFYRLYGRYVVDRVAYHSDPKDQGVVGFRSLYLKPHGEPALPDFS